MFLLYPLCLLPVALLAAAVALVDASSNFGALGLYTWRFPADLAIVVMFSTGTLAITGGIVRRAEHGRSLRQPYWRRHLHYCIGLYLVVLMCSPSLLCGATRTCGGPDHALAFIIGLCALTACAIQAIALASVQRRARLPRASITALRGSTL